MLFHQIDTELDLQVILTPSASPELFHDFFMLKQVIVVGGNIAYICIFDIKRFARMPTVCCLDCLADALPPSKHSTTPLPASAPREAHVPASDGTNTIRVVWLGFSGMVCR